MRSAAELRSRLGQEWVNLYRFVLPPAVPRMALPRSPLPGLPDPGPVAAQLRGTAFAAQVVGLAESVLDRRLPLLGLEIRTDQRIRWRRDYVHGIESGAGFFRRLPYLDFSRVGDHKVVWELNRHQHLVLLAQAFLFTGRREFLHDIQAQIATWMEDNPWLRGMNWASALEVGLRALSWIWVYHLAGGHLDPEFRARWLGELYRHGLYLERNLSVYFSPNTHLLGEALALHAIGRLFPAFPRAANWERLGGAIVQEQIAAQVRDDGTHVEQSTYYHVYALDMFLLHAVLAETGPSYRARLAAMAEYLAAVTGPARRLPFIGDDDGGRLFHPYGPRDRFARATLATAGALLGRPEWIAGDADLHEQAAWYVGQAILPAAGFPAGFVSRLFTGAGTAILTDGYLHMVADAGPFGPWSAGHSHSDTLQFIARTRTEELLIDPGTYTYVADPQERNRFRRNAAHNTIRVDETDYPPPRGPFGWMEKPQVEVLTWDSNERHAYLDAVCRAHRRRLLFLKPGLVIVLDEVDGEGERLVERFWHFGERVEQIAPHAFRIGARACLLLDRPGGELSEGGEYGWRSRTFGRKEPAPVLRVARRCELPCRLAAVLDLSGAAAQLTLDGLQLEYGGVKVAYSATGVPRYS